MPVRLPVLLLAAFGLGLRPTGLAAQTYLTIAGMTVVARLIAAAG